MVQSNNFNEEQRVFFTLIKEFIACAKYSCELFKEIYNGEEPYLYAYRALKKLPKDGYINNVYFNFHGGGCYFEYEDSGLCIDVEFDENDNCDGLNCFRLFSFINSKEGKNNYFKSESDVKRLFDQFVELGILVKKKTRFDSKLYYLNI